MDRPRTSEERAYPGSGVSRSAPIFFWRWALAMDYFTELLDNVMSSLSSKSAVEQAAQWILDNPQFHMFVQIKIRQVCSHHHVLHA